MQSKSQKAEISDASGAPVVSGPQLRALRWMDENDSYESEWLANGKPITRQKPETWNQFRISGPTGSIILSADDMQALKPFIVACATRHQMYSPNEAGRALLASSREVRS